ncbi:MAG: uracil-DNA glycosylase [Polaromonas sp.]|nr:uracil-DNA glycosylase [Polaromonas sp.]
MSLDLDTRQRAMLQEMGVRVWAPLAAPEPQAVSSESAMAQSAYVAQSAAVPVVAATLAAPAAPIAELISPAPVSATPDHVPQEQLPSPSRVTELASGIAGMNWPELAETVRHCQACAMCLGRRAPVLAAPGKASACDWLLVADPPDEAQERAGQPFVDEAGQLLDNMLRAVAVQRWNHDAGAGTGHGAASRAYLTPVLKCRPALTRAPSAAELDTCAHFLRREIALTQPRVILAMGRFAMQLLLSETPPDQARLPLGKLRGQVWRFADVPVVVTYPPAYLLRNGQDKARAWADLCLARAVATGKLVRP